MGALVGAGGQVSVAHMQVGWALLCGPVAVTSG